MNKTILDLLDDMSSGKTNLNRFKSAVQKELSGLGKEKISKKELLPLIEKNVWILEESEGRGINYEALTGKLKKILKEEEKRFSSEVYLKNFVDANIFRLGIEVGCLKCQRFSWYPINNLDYDMKCPKCSETFKLPQESVGNIKLSYSSVGSLRQPN